MDKNNENKPSGILGKVLDFTMKVQRTFNEVDAETRKTANTADASSMGISGRILWLFLLPFKIPAFVKGLSGIARKIKSVVDKVPLCVFQTKLIRLLDGKINVMQGNGKISKYFQTMSKYSKKPTAPQPQPDLLSGKDALFVTIHGFFFFVGLSFVTAILILLADLGLESDFNLQVFSAIILIFAVLGTIVLSYISMAAIRIMQFEITNVENVKSVILATDAFILNIAFLALIIFATVASFKH